MRKFQIILTSLLIIVPAFLQAQKTNDRVSMSLTGSTFLIKNVEAGKYLDIPGYGNKADRSNGAKVQLWDLDKGKDRRVRFVPAGNGYYYIRFQHTNSNLDIHGCYKDKLFCGTYKTDNGAKAQIWSAGSSKPQQWEIKRVGHGEYKFVNRYSGKVLDASASQIHKNGCKVQQWKWHGGDNQRWILIDDDSGSRFNK